MNVFETIKKIISNQLGVAPEEIELKSHLKDDLNADPLSIGDLVTSIESEFKINVPQEEVINFQTVEDIVNYISDQLGTS